MIDNVYDALDRMTEMHRPTGVTTYNTWNKQDQITRMRTVCDECKWVISDYTYTYDTRGFVTSEKAIESIYQYPTVSNTYTQYKDMVPQTAAHKSLHHSTGTKPDYRMATTFRTFCYDNDGRLIFSTENEENEGRTIYTYSYDDNGNRTGYQKCVNGYITERIAFWYDVDNELRRATHTYGTREYNVNYTYDNDGNLITEKGSTGSYNVNKTYQYTVENRLQAVYEGNDLLLALAYDGDGNKVFQMSYDPYTNATGKTGINSPNPKERSQTELDLRSMIKTSGKINSYSLVEYITDVNTGYIKGIQYPEVLMELNMNGETDTVYVYGNERIQKDKYTGLKNYYIYNGRGSVTSNLSSQGRLTASYRYTPYGELSYGQNHSYANAYTFNGENYHPMTNTQYLRTRVYQTKTGRFLTQDTYLGDITNPITTNRYIYCIDNPLNYKDPSGYDSYVIYDEKEFSNQAKAEKKRLIKEHGYSNDEVIMLPLKTDATDDQFKQAWDKLSDSERVEEVSLLFHSQPHKLLMPENTTAITTTEKNNDPNAEKHGKTSIGRKVYTVSDLAVYDIGIINLLSCNSGHLDHDNNLAIAFLENQNVEMVVAWDGNLSYTKKDEDYIPRLAHYVQFSYYKYLLTHRFRSPIGEVIYYKNKNDIRVKYTQIFEVRDDYGIDRMAFIIDRVFERSEVHRCAYE